MPYEILISGIVQGVGFRPFVYNLANKHNLKGYVTNYASSALIVVEGKNIESFLKDLGSNPPANAIINEIKIKKLEFSRGFKNFSIKKSKFSDFSLINSALPLDLVICKDCLNEMESKSNRRFNYAFINCINCGPRYSIIKALPYDRVRTSMSEFKMCESCNSEYLDISNRRFHAQPNSCPKCGIEISLYDNANKKLESKNPLLKAKELIYKNKILAIKGIGGFNLVCNINRNTIKKLREKKRRPTKPFAVMFRDLSHIEEYFKLTKIEKNILDSKSAPILLLQKRSLKPIKSLSFKSTPLKDNQSIPNNLAPNLSTIGVIIAYSPLHKLLLKGLKEPLIFTSANISNEPLIKDRFEAFDKLGVVFDYLIDHNREIVNEIDDSLKMLLINKKEILLRAGRGIYPLMIKSNFYAEKPILALGANQKSQIAIFYKNNVIISPYIGDLVSVDSIRRFGEMIDLILSIYKISPKIILRDCHNAYESSKIATSLASKYCAKVYKIFHHKAHFYSNLFDNALLGEKRILGVIFDGTGFGRDKAIWGGEFFLKESIKYKSFSKEKTNAKSKDLINQTNQIKRIAHFKYFSLLGGESAIRDIKKIALGLLFSVYEREIPKIFNFSNIDLYYKMHKNRLNSPLTSSVGRIFDGVAFFCGLEKQSYEGESGAYIEYLYNPKIKQIFSYEIKGDEIILDSMIREIICILESAKYEESTQNSGSVDNPKMDNKKMDSVRVNNIGQSNFLQNQAKRNKLAQSQMLLSKTIESKMQKNLHKKEVQKIRLNEARIEIASRFINTIADTILTIAKKYRLKVAFSGGVFQNKVLCDKIISLFKKEKIEFFMHDKIPPNDGGISLGQIASFLNNDFEIIES